MFDQYNFLYIKSIVFLESEAKRGGLRDTSNAVETRLPTQIIQHYQIDFQAIIDMPSVKK